MGNSFKVIANIIKPQKTFHRINRLLAPLTDSLLVVEDVHQPKILCTKVSLKTG